MAFAANGLRRCDYGGHNGTNAVSQFSYTTTDAAATVEAANYFNSAYQQFNKGDTIDAVMAVGGTPVRKNYVVTSASGATTVVVALQTTTAG